MREEQTRNEGGRVEIRKQGRRKGYIILKLISDHCVSTCHITSLIMT